MKKQLLAAILSAAMILGLTACGGTSTQTPAADTAAAAEETAQAADTAQSVARSCKSCASPYAPFAERKIFPAQNSACRAARP